MNKILRKLRSKAGESMILAMVFMLFCVFVGGSVLASATANAYRVEHLSDQQDFLSQRSAAKLISDELKVGNKNLELKIRDVELSAKELMYVDGGGLIPTGKTDKVRTVTFEATDGLVMTPFQRLILETAVARYLEENNLAPSEMPATGKTTVVVVLKNFTYSKIKNDGSTEEVNITSVNDFWLKNSQKLDTRGELELTGTDNLGITRIPVVVESCGGERLFDFAVSFGDYSQMTLAMVASRGEEKPTKELGNIISYSNGSTVDWLHAEVDSCTRKTGVWWDDPLIEKGGV